jgi:hypothetical protein
VKMPELVDALVDLAEAGGGHELVHFLPGCAGA